MNICNNFKNAFSPHTLQKPDDPVDDALYMVFELVTQGEVLNIPTDNPLSEERAWFIFRQVILGMREQKQNYFTNF